MSNQHDVLEQNVSTLLETGGEAPRISEPARARIRSELLLKHGAHAAARTRKPLIAIAIGVAAACALALLLLRLVGSGSGQAPAAPGTLADGSTFVIEQGAKVTVLGPRHLRVEGAALLDVVPGQGTFVVETARARVEVLGTRFLVDGQAQRTVTAVVRGQVKLSNDGGEVLLHAGEQGVAEPGHVPTRMPAPRLSHLVSWARAQRAEHAAEPLHHGTLFARDPGVRSHPPWGEEYPLPIKQLTLDVVVEDRVARVAMDQTFHNNEPQELEGVYRFAIPSDAALERLAMYVDGRLEESAVVERMRARRIYEELVYRRVDPALLEWAGTGRLSLRVYPIHALQDKRLVLAYTQSLPKLYDDWTLSIPMPEVDGTVGELAASVRVKGCANCELTSPSHAIEVTRDGDDAIVKYRHTAVKIGDSFVVHVREPGKRTLLAKSGEYLMVRASAELGGQPRAYRPRTWVIVDDVSASRGTMELRAQADLVDAFLHELDEQDKVAIVAFDVEARQKLAPTRVIDVDRRAVRRSLETEGGVGATDIGAGIDAAMTALVGVAPDDAMIVYLGDGVITSGSQHLDELRAKIAGKAHFIGVGVGDGPDTQTLGALAAATGGYTTTIDLADDVSWRAFDLVAALHTQRATGIEARLVDAAGELVPATLYLDAPQVADGEEIGVVAKLAGSGTPAALEVSGMLDGQPWHRSIPLAGAGNTHAGYLPRLWAQRHIAARLLAKQEPVAIPPCTKDCKTPEQLREDRDEGIRKEVVALGKRYFLLSRHTSLLVLENDEMYRKYDVQKGDGDTWAPYALPATIPVITAGTAPTVPASVAEDAELVRMPLQVFYQNNITVEDRSIINLPPADITRWGWDRDAAGSERRGFFRDGELRKRGGDDDHKGYDGHELGDPFAVVGAAGKGEAIDESKTRTITTAQLGVLGNIDSQSTEQGVTIVRPDGRVLSQLDFEGEHGRYWTAAAGPLTPMHLGYPGDPAYDDMTGFVPALTADGFDRWRQLLSSVGAPRQQHVVDDTARAVLVEARRRLAPGIYRWGDLELAVDGARRIGWKRTTDHGLFETASVDGTTWTRRYAELGLDATRPVGDDDVALALAYLPIWIAEPQHYARWFDVKSRGPREVVLTTIERGKSHVAFVLSFDDQFRLVAISSERGGKLVEVDWNATGPIAARMHGDAISAGYTNTVVADATAWAHGATQPGVVVELPGHLPAYWATKLAAETPGSPAWRRIARQRMVSLAATEDRSNLWQAFVELRAHGGAELGDVALASGAIATSATVDAVAAYGDQPLVRYLRAGLAFRRNPSRLDGFAPGTRDGLVGALWSLRAVTAELAAGHGKAAADALIAMGDRAEQLRLVAAAAAASRWDIAAKDIRQMWDAVATGRYVNLARVQSAQALYNHNNYEEAADVVMDAVEHLDVHALPARFELLQYAFNNSRRGLAGWQIVWARWRDKVLASNSFDHLIALVPAATAAHEADLPTLLTRALALAGDDDDRQLAVARLANAYGQAAWAEQVLQPLLAKSPTREMYQLVAAIQLAQNRQAEALASLEAAQDAGANESVDINVVRSELGQIIAVAQALAVTSTGATRQHAIERALAWGTRWRALDPGNTTIDLRLGEMMLAVGDTAAAWRQLSGVIERDPWAGTGYTTVAELFERQGKVAESLPYWQQAIVIDQTNPAPRLRKAQALIALGRSAEGDALLHQIVDQHWHDVHSNIVYEAKDLLARAKRVQ